MYTRDEIKNALYQKYIAKTERKKKRLIGVEIEMPVAKTDGSATDYEAVQEAFQEMIRKYDLKPEKYDDNGVCYLAINEDNGDSFSFDCSYNNLELSLGCGEKMAEIQERFENYVRAINLELEKSGHILTAVTAASPVLDKSFVEKGRIGENIHNGMASVRCSELGYWNQFTPVLDYSGIQGYTDSIQQYVKMGLIAAPSELYYPVRLKPAGAYNLEKLMTDGADHIELRMFDLNPLCKEGIDIRDLKFAQLLLIWLLGSPREAFSKRDQVQAAQNFKNAAHYDLKTVKIVFPSGEVCSVSDAGMKVIDRMKAFFRGYPEEVQAILDFEDRKFIDPENRYAWKLQKILASGFVEEGLKIAKNNAGE